MRKSSQTTTRFTISTQIFLSFFPVSLWEPTIFCPAGSRSACFWSFLPQPPPAPVGGGTFPGNKL